MEGWRKLESRVVRRCGIFDLHQARFAAPDGRPDGEFYVVEAPEWINVVALDDERRVLLVRQYRFGIEDFTLEIPGGMCDPGEAPLDTARRELREETGFEAAEWSALGWVHPNPPVQNNRCHTFLARGLARVGEQQLDAHEALEVRAVPLDEIPNLVASGAITHSLVIAAFRLYELKRPAD